MSEDTRQALADAANTVDGITVSPYFQQVTKTGAGMVVLARMTRAANGFGFVNTWQVLIVQPSELDKAEQFFESKVPDLIEALSPLGQIASVTPDQLTLEGGISKPAFYIELNREAD